MTAPLEELRKLEERLAARERREVTGPPLRRIPKPIYVLNVDKPDPQAIVMVVRQDSAGAWTGKIVLPELQELPAGWDGPHAIDVAVRLADDYAHAYGYSGIAIDIESSQLWDPAWGRLEPKSPDFD